MTATIEPVIDSPEFVFRYWVDNILNPEFMDYAETDLTGPAVKILSRLLTEEWHQRGHRMIPLRFELFNRLSEMENLINPTVLPAASLSNEVWDAAVARLEFDDIIAEAGLTREYGTFVRAQPDYNH